MLPSHGLDALDGALLPDYPLKQETVVSWGEEMAHFVEPRSEDPIVIYEDEDVRVVKNRTQIHTGEWNKELIIEVRSGTDAVGNDRWLELSGSYLDRHIRRRPLHEANWKVIRAVSQIICQEEEKDDYDYIYYINRGRYRVKGEESETEAEEPVA